MDEQVAFDHAGGWSGVLGTLTGRGDLTADVAGAAMAEILEGNATPAQIAGFIVALRMKGETVEELTGLVSAMIDRATPVTLADPEGVIDIVGTGGDRSHSINVSTLAALTIAGAGGRVCKHGNRAASSACGTADVLEALGVAFDLGPAGVAHCVDSVGIGFCFAPRFHGAMRHAGPPRRELGVPTVFNFLGPLANPARVRRQVTGVADAAMAERMVQVLAAKGSERALVVYGHDGLDELTITTTSTVYELRDGEIWSYDVDPADWGLGGGTLDDLRGGDAATNAELSRRILSGERGPKADIVILNAAAGLLAAGVVDDLGAGVEAARVSLDEGGAAAALDSLVRASNEAAAREA
ncbi:MAG: anthranilate phosphoribosyltransferase [Microthrixaceae bacterium]|nr:anthranilate phosphoribosyltransferase [Microthrixaceae bacterium]